MTNLLEYIEPRRFIDTERIFCLEASVDLLMPDDSGCYEGSSGMCSYDAIVSLCSKNKPAFGRANAAWYLRASGMSYAAIGDLFEISSSRASGIIKSIRNKVHSCAWAKKQWDDSVIRQIEKALFPTVSIGVQNAHRMIQTFSQMRDVEYLMARHHTSQYALNSGVLRLGHAQLEKMRDDVGAYRCVCTYCKPVHFPEHVEFAEAVV